MAHIFVIENDPDFADCLQRILSADGYDVTCSSNISEAVRILEDLRPDLAIVDLDDGDVIKPSDIENLTGLDREIPVLVTAIYKTPELAFKALGVGAREYLLKPFGTSEILRLVRRLTSGEIPEVKTDYVSQISDSIRILNSVDDILKTTLNQLANTLHLSDCLIALKENDGFRIQASRGYDPDPVSNTIRLSKDITDHLMQETLDTVNIVADIVADIVVKLEIRGNRPFPTLMPLIGRNSSANELMGFVLGHGALELEENDLLEMERFLNIVVSEIASLLESGMVNERIIPPLHDGEYRIPEISRDMAVREILDVITPFLADQADRFWIRLAIDEAISNAIEHGHGEPLTQPRTNLCLKYQINTEQIIVAVEDRGEGFDYDNVPDPTADENLLSINGRGIYLMRRIMDSVFYNDRGNSITLVKKIDGIPMDPF